MIVHSFYVIIAFPQAARHVQLMPQSESLFTEHKNHQGQELSGSVRLTLPPLFENQEIFAAFTQAFARLSAPEYRMAADRDGSQYYR